MTIPVFFNGKIVGEIEINPSGIYTEFCVDAEIVSNNVLKCRIRGDGELRLGVLQPENGRLKLRKLCSRSQLSGLGVPHHGELFETQGVKACEIHGWTVCNEPERFLRDAFACQCLSGYTLMVHRDICGDYTLAVQYSRSLPMKYVGILCLMRPSMVNGNLMLEVRVGADGCLKKW